MKIKALTKLFNSQHIGNLIIFFKYVEKFKLEDYVEFLDILSKTPIEDKIRHKFSNDIGELHILIYWAIIDHPMLFINISLKKQNKYHPCQMQFEEVNVDYNLKKSLKKFKQFAKFFIAIFNEDHETFSTLKIDFFKWYHNV